MKHCLLFLSLLIVPILVFSQENSINEWNMVFDKEQISQEQVNEFAPNFPQLEKFESSNKLNAALSSWRKNNTSEWTKLDEHFDLSNNYSLVYLGLYSAQEYEAFINNRFIHGWLDYVEAAGITDKRLNDIAPNLPKAPVNATAADRPEYDHKFEMWRVLYAHEYEALVNAPEIAAVNPFYDGYVDVVGIPKYVRALETDEFPVKQSSEDPYFDELLFELQKQSWYFIFEPNVFKREYGFEPILPENFDVVTFRASVIERIELNKRIESGALEVDTDY